MTHTHTYAILEISADAWQEVSARLKDAASCDFERDYLGEDDGKPILVLGTVALKALPQVR